jgi:hypothetical protein
MVALLLDQRIKAPLPEGIVPDAKWPACFGCACLMDPCP